MGKLWGCLLAVPLCLGLGLVGAVEVLPERKYTPDDVFRLAARHASTLDPDSARFAQYFSLHAIPQERRWIKTQFLGYVLNGFSHRVKLALPVVVDGCDGVLVYADLRDYRAELAEVIDRLAVTGSGSAPFPDPFFHQVTVVVEDIPQWKEVPEWTDETKECWEETGTYYNGYPVKRKVLKTERVRHLRRVSATPLHRERYEVVQPPWIGKDALVGMFELTHRQSPVLEYEWFVTNATIEPFYHQLVGLGETLESVERFAGVDARQADEAGSILRGAVLFSEVATRNRILERLPLLKRHGRSAFHQSLDFLSSVRKQDVLKNLLISKPDAREIIFFLNNGMLAYFVVDGQGKRLDFANPLIAQDSRTPLRDKLVWGGRNCMGCHLSEKGFIPVSDEVRGFARHQIKLEVQRSSLGDPLRSKRIEERFLLTDFNELIQNDQVWHEQAVRAATGGLSCEEVREELQDTIVSYSDRPVTLVSLTRQTGYQLGEVKRVVEGLQGGDHTLAGLAVGRKQRRDQVEAAMAQLFSALYLQRLAR